MGHVTSHSTKLLILLDRAGERDEEEQHPRYSDFGEHLEIDATQSRIERNTHEMVVNDIAAHA